MIFTVIKTKQKIIKNLLYIIISLDQKKKEERISVVKWVRTSLYGDYVADFAGTGNLLNGRHKIFPSETFQCCSSQTLMFLFPHCVITDTGDIFAT